MIRYSLILSLLIFVFGLTEKSGKIHIGLIVDESIPKETVKFIIKELEGYFNAKVHITNNLELPVEFKKDTINAKKLIDYIQKELTLSYKKNIYFTNRGITLNDSARFSIRGFAMLGGKLGVVSTLVIKDESTSKKQYEDLLAKVLIHEMAHLLGLEHCSDSDKCVLVSSIPNPKKFYNAKKELCEFCIEKLDKGLIKKKYHRSKF